MNVKADLNRYVDRTCTWILDKIGENNPKIREKAEEAGLAMSSHKSIGPLVLVNHITKGQVKKTAVNSVKHISGKLALLRKIIEQEGIEQGKISVDICCDFAIGHS